MERLLEASENGDEGVVVQLLSEGAHINATDEYGLTPLMWAASSGHERVVGLLLENRADIEARSCYGTALHNAAEGGYQGVVSLLLEGGADFNAEDEEGLTPLQVAVRKQRRLMRLPLMQSWTTQYEAVVELLQSYSETFGKQGMETC